MYQFCIVAKRAAAEAKLKAEVATLVPPPDPPPDPQPQTQKVDVINWSGFLFAMHSPHIPLGSE